MTRSKSNPLLVMRTAVSNAPSLRHLHWQAAFTTKAYQNFIAGLLAARVRV